MLEPLDLDKIEEELKQINSLPFLERIYSDFTLQSPERIAALVKRVRELEEENKLRIKGQHDLVNVIIDALESLEPK